MHREAQPEVIVMQTPPFATATAHRHRSGWLRACLLLILLAGAQSAAEAADRTPAGGDRVALDEVRSGTLLARTGGDGGGHVPLPAVDSRVRVRVTGPLARTVIRQRFTNPTADWVEAVYAFPLPEDAAVDTLRLRIGERVIEGEIREREQARRTYEMARDAGQRTALVEQQRPNLFTTSVANIPPGAEISVEIAYQHVLEWRDQQFSLRVPLAITPRYGRSEDDTVSGPLATAEAARDGWMLLPGEVGNTARNDATSPVDLEVALDPGFAPADVHSRHHAIAREPMGDGSGTRVRLAPGATADRDFVLSWAPATDTAPQAAFFTEALDGGQYGLFMLMPPSAASAGPPPARELIFVLDVSGSMAGVPIRAAKAALDRALSRLRPRDRFNIVAFNHVATRFHDGALSASPQSIARARRWVERLSADGGTELLGGLRAALTTKSGEIERLRQIVFITDGAIADHEPLFRAMTRELGDDRLFTVGIGHAPNTHLMTEMAHFGRGTSTMIASPGEVAERMDALFRQLETPAVTDLALSLPVKAEVLPERLPDLYAGEPLMVLMRLEGTPHRIAIEGKRNQGVWRRDLSLPPPAAHSGIAKAWARERLRQWQRDEARGADPETVRTESLTLALTHGLVSRFTSLVAVDRTPARVREAMLERHDIGRELPHGMTGTEVRMAQTATPAQLLMLVAGLLLLLSALLWILDGRSMRAGNRPCA